MLKEKYDCIYSKTEAQCKATSESFTQNTKCVWFSYGNISPRTQCYGVYDLTDYEFNRLIPYFELDNMYFENKVLNFSFFGRNDKVIKGTFDLKYNYIMMENFTYDKKISIEMGSQDAIYSFSKRQTFVGFKDYKLEKYGHHIFLYTSSPVEYNNKIFAIITRYKYKKIGYRNLEENNKEYIEEIIPCNPISIKNNDNFKLTLSECKILNPNELEIKIEKGIDLIGNFEDKRGIIFEGIQFMNSSVEQKIKEECSIFTVIFPKIFSNYLKGNTTIDRKNVTFFFYYSKDSKVQTIQSKGSFLKENSTVSFEMSPLVDLEKGNTFIPEQLCQAEDGEYLYIKNTLGSFYSNFNNDYYYNNPTTTPTTAPTTVPTTKLTTKPTTNNHNDDISNNYNNPTNKIKNDNDEEATDNSEGSGINETWIRVDKGEILFTMRFSIIFIYTLLWFI